MPVVRLYVALFSTIALSGSIFDAQAVDIDALLFYAPFDGAPNAAVARGDALATVVTEGAFEFIDGIRGQAIVFGGRGEQSKGQMALGYKTSSNLLPSTGTVAFWSQAIDWLDFGLSGRFYTWMRVDIEAPAGGSWSIYRDGAGGLTGMWVKQGEKLFWTPSYSPTWEWPKGGNLWWHIAYTWQPGEVRFYLNGKLAGRYTEELPSIQKFNDTFYLGRDDPWKVAIDEFYIFRSALTDFDIRALYRLGRGELESPEFTVPRLEKRPEIDGKITREDWQGTALIQGLTDGALGVRSDETTRISAGYDDQHLFLALEYDIPERVRSSRQLFPNGALRRTASRRDAVMTGDDHYEVSLAIDGKSSRYRLRINALGTMADDQNGDVSWNGSWQARSHDDEFKWTVELEIPFADMGIDPTTEDSIALNVRREWGTLGPKWASLALGGGDRILHIKKPDSSFERQVEPGQAPKSYDIVRGGDVLGFARVALAKDVPYARIDAIERLDQGIIGVQGTIVNPGEATSITIQSSVGDVFSFRDILKVRSDGSSPFEISGQLSREYAGDLAFEIDSDRGQVAHVKLPFSYSSSFTVDLACYPSNNRLLLTIYPGLEVEKGTSARARILTHSEQPTTVAEVLTESFENGTGRVEFDTSKLSPAEYKIDVQLKSGDDLIARSTTPFVKQDRPPWLANDLGKPTTVPAPWSPVTVDGTNVSVWGREYRFEDSVLFSQVRSADRELLASPARIVVRKGEDSHKLEFVASRCTAQSDLEATIETEGIVKTTGGALSVKATTRVEFDGFTWTELTFQPGGRGTSDVDGIAVEIPFQPERSGLYYVGDYTSRTLGKIRPWKSDHFGSFQWLGDEFAGMQWYAQSDRNWWHKGAGQVEIVPGESENLLRLQLMTSPAKVVRPVTIALGFMATPVSRKRPDWRHFKWSWFAGEHDRKLLLWFTGWGEGVSWPVLKPMDDSMWQAHARNRQQGIVPHLYLGGATSSPFSPEYRHFQSEWRPIPSPTYDIDALSKTMGQSEGMRVEICPASSYQDFLVYHLAKIVREEERDIQGFYFDNTWPKHCMNESHGCGYVDEEGERHPELPILRTREMFKRIYVSMKEVRPNNMLSFHMSGEVYMPMLAFAGVWLDGEQFATGLIRHASETGKKSFHDYMTLDRFRATFMGHQWGGQITLMLSELWALAETGNRDSEFGYAQGGDLEIDRAAEHLSGMQMLHDVHPTGGTNVSLVLLAIQKEFGWDEKTEFLPYWNNAEYVHIDSGDVEPVVCSVFRREGKLMLILFNDSDQDAQVDVTLDFESLDVKRTPANILRDPVGYNQHGGGGFTKEAARLVVAALRRFHSDKPERLRTHGNREGLFVLVDDSARVPVMKRNYRLLLVE